VLLSLIVTLVLAFKTIDTFDSATNSLSEPVLLLSIVSMILAIGYACLVSLSHQRFKPLTLAAIQQQQLIEQ
jgi:hypothetical protein